LFVLFAQSSPLFFFPFLYLNQSEKSFMAMHISSQAFSFSVFGVPCVNNRLISRNNASKQNNSFPKQPCLFACGYRLGEQKR
jgi:hypothetical protein